MTRLMVSVRDAEEASIALDAGASLIDVKEPERGPLGAADAAVIHEVCARVAGRVPISAALGELVEQPEGDLARRTAGVQFAKLGLASCALRDDWPELWSHVADVLDAAAAPITVVYADWRRANAPEPADVLRHAETSGCRGVLVDTFDKSCGGLLECMDCHQLMKLIGRCRTLGLSIVLAGSLSRRTIPAVLPLGADYLAVRGAACAGGRTGPIDGNRVRELVRLVHGESMA